MMASTGAGTMAKSSGSKPIHAKFQCTDVEAGRERGGL